MKKIAAILGIVLFFLTNVYSQTFTSSPSAPINDLTDTYDYITVSGLGGLDVLTTVTINISHTWDGDLDIYLIDPLGNEHLLSDDNGGSGDNYTNTSFTNTAGTSITLGAAPFTGTFLPECGSLPTGLYPNDDWGIHIYDDASGDTGTLLSWSLTFSAPPCPTVGFNGLPASMNCNDASVILYPNDSATANGAIYPSLYFQYTTDANGSVDNQVEIYENGGLGLIYSNYAMDNNTVLTVYATGPFFDPTLNYTTNIYEGFGDSGIDFVCYDGNGTVYETWVYPNGTTGWLTRGPFVPAGTSTWSSTSSGITGTAPWGAAVFDPAAAGPGTWSVTYCFDNGASCSNCASQTVVVNNPWNAAWTTPGSICESDGSVNLDSYVTGDAGGTWSGTGVSGSTFNPAGLSGNVSITYTVGSGAPCEDSETHTINVIPLATAEAGNNATICAGNTYTVSGASYGGSATACLWSTSGTGTFTNGNTTTPTYTPSAADISAGSVTLTITATGPCASASDNMILTITPLDDAYFTYSSGTFCQTGTNPTPTVNTPGGTFTSSPAGLIINSSTGLIDLDASTPQTYTVTYTTNGACPNSSNVSITITSGFDAEFSYVTPICEVGTNPLPSHTTGSDGIYSASPAGLNFVNTSTGEIDLSTTAPGTYTVTNTIAASGGCAAATYNQVIQIDQAPTASAGSDMTICEGSTCTPTGSMGGSAANVNWSTSGDGTFLYGSTTTPTYTPGAGDISAGTVTLTITTNDPAGPCGPASDDMILTINPAATVNAGADQTICQGESYTISGATMGGSTSSIQWSTSGDGFFDNLGILNATYTPGTNDIANGSVTLTVTTNDPAGPCPAVSDQMILTINPAATVSAGNDTSICQGISYTLNGTFGGGASSITWTTDGTGTFDNNTIANATYTPSTADISAGQVNIIITTDDPDNSGPCVAVTDTMVLTIFPVATIDSVITTQVTSCLTPNATIDIYASGGTSPYQYSIDNGANYGAFSSFTGLDVGTYNIVVSDQNSCTTTATTSITSSSGPIIDTVLYTEPLCYGDSTAQLVVTVSNMDSLTYTIDNWSTYQTDSIFTNLPAGTYDIEVEDTLGCKDAYQITISEPAQLVLDTLQVVPASCGATGSATIIVTGGTPNYQYLWDTGDTTTTISNVISGTYSVTVQDANGCFDSLLVTIPNGGGSANVIITDTLMPLCNGDTTGYAIAQMSGGYAPYTYIWSNGSTDSVATGLGAGTYDVTITDNFGCVGVQSITITEPAAISGNLFITNVDCYGTKTGEINVSTTGGVPPYVYTWSPSGFTQNGSIYSGLPAGGYNLTITDANNCTYSVIEINVTQPQPIDVMYTATDPMCYGEATGKIEASASGGTSPYDYIWTNVNFSAPIDTSILDSVIAGNYYLEVIDSNSCDTTIMITLNEAPEMTLTITDTVIAYQGSASVLVSGGTSPYIYQWSNSATTSEITGLATGVYTITVTDANQCSVIDTIEIKIPLLIPSLFTPNGDGYNDTWRITNIAEYKDVNIEIYNRWGDLIYSFNGSGSEYLSNEWDGTYNDNELPVGSYVYIITISELEQPYNGVVSIKR